MSPGPAEVPAGSPSRSNGRGRSATRSRPLKSVSSLVRGSRVAKSRAAGPSTRVPVSSVPFMVSLIRTAVAPLRAVLLVGGVVGVLRQRAVDLVGDRLQPFVADVRAGGDEGDVG